MYFLRINQLEEEQQGVAIALSEAQRKLEDEKARAHQLTVQVTDNLLHLCL